MAAKKSTAKKSITIVGNVQVLAERPAAPVVFDEVVFTAHLGVTEFVMGLQKAPVPYHTRELVTRIIPQTEYTAREFPAGEFDGNVLAHMIRLTDAGFSNVRAVDTYTRGTLKDSFTRPEMTKLRTRFNIPAPAVAKPTRTRKTATRKAA